MFAILWNFDEKHVIDEAPSFTHQALHNLPGNNKIDLALLEGCWTKCSTMLEEQAQQCPEKLDYESKISTVISVILRQNLLILYVIFYISYIHKVLKLWNDFSEFAWRYVFFKNKLCRLKRRGQSQSPVPRVRMQFFLALQPKTTVQSSQKHNMFLAFWTCLCKL